MTECEKFWLEHPLSLFTNFDILPERSMCTSSKLNAATRLSLVIALVLYFAKIENWYLFLAVSLTFIVLLKYVFCKQLSREEYTSIPTLNPVWYHDQSTPIESIDSRCGEDFELISDDASYIENDIEYVDDEFQPRRFFGVSNLMPGEEEQPENLDRKQLQQLNSCKFADRTVEARESIVHIFKKQMAERFEPDEYYESY